MSIALGLALIATANVGYWYWHTSRTPKVDNTPWKDRYALVQAQHEKELAHFRNLMQLNNKFHADFRDALSQENQPKEVKRLALEVKIVSTVGSFASSLKTEMAKLNPQLVYETTVTLKWHNSQTKKNEHTVLNLKGSAAQALKDAVEHIKTRDALTEFCYSHNQDYELNGKALKWKNITAQVDCHVIAHTVEIIHEPVIIKVPVVEYQPVEVERVIFFESESKPEVSNVDKDYIAALVEVTLNEQLAKKAAGSRITQ